MRIKVMINLPRCVVVLGLSVFLLWTEAGWAVNIPLPMSKGKFIESKGTKAAAEFEGRAGRPGYEYESRMQLGNVFLKPYVDYQVVWDDNIFLDAKDEDQDFINDLRAGFGADWPIGGGQHLVAASYGIHSQFFNDFQDQDHTDHNIQVGGEFNFVPFSVTVQDTFSQTVSRADTEFTSRVKRDQNALDALLEIPFTQFFLETEVVDFDVDFRRPEDSTFDRHLFTIYQRAGVDYSPATQLLFEYGFTDIHYREVDDREGDANQVAFGARGNWTERITYQIWGGYQAREYDSDLRPGFFDAVWRGALSYNISATGTVTLRGDRTPQESTFDGQSWYVRNRAEIDWRQQIAERWYFQTREVFSFNEYSRVTVLTGGDQKTREDAVWQAAAGIEYLMPNDIFAFLVEYRFRARDSKISTLDYDNQTLTFGVRASY